WLEPEPEPGGDELTDQQRLVSELSGVKVSCRGGACHRLRDSFLPIDEFVSAADGLVPFLRVREPEHARWQALGVLGVGVKSGVDFYLLCLSELSESGSAVKLSRVKLLLNQVEARCREEDRQRVRYA